MQLILVSILLATASLSSCGNARTIVPDANNPAHCMAAENIWMVTFERSGYVHQAFGMKVRALRELSRVQASGNVSAARAEGITLSRELLKDSKATDALALACGNAEEANPNFAKNISRLSELARRGSGFL
jgi:hypothetical protein